MAEVLNEIHAFGQEFTRSIFIFSDVFLKKNLACSSHIEVKVCFLKEPASPAYVSLKCVCSVVIVAFLTGEHVT